MTAKVKMYATAACPYCRQAEALLREVGASELEKVRVDLYPSQFHFMCERTGRKTVPQIFIGETYVGGFNELVVLHRSGRLLSLFDQPNLEP